MTQPKIDPRYTTVGRLFRENFIFRVPKYQRGYAWGESEVEDFLNDIWKCYDARSANNPSHHLFGGVVSAEGPSPGSRRLCELIDGQQRIATFTIFAIRLVLIYEKLAAGKGGSATTVANRKTAASRATRLREKYLQYEDEINRQSVTVERFELSNRDQLFFKELITGSDPSPLRDSHERLKAAFIQIGTRLESLTDKHSTLLKKLDALQRIEETLDGDCTVIHIITDSREEAYRLFQVLNDRGISLTEGDLLRARTLEMLGAPEFKEQQEAIESSWDQILADPPEVIKRFLMWFYASVIGERPIKTSLFDNFLDGLFPQHFKPKLSTADGKKVVGTVKQIREEVVLFRKLQEGEWPYSQGAPIKQWDRDRLNLLINGLEHELAMPLLLAACKLDHKRFSQVVQLVERFAFRYKNISNQHINSLAKIYHKHAVAIRENPARYKSATLKADLHSLQERKVPDPIFKAALENELKFSISTGNKTLRYFLVNAEYYVDWFDSGAAGEPKCKDKMRVFDFANTTIEHVYPLHADSGVKDATLEPLKNDLGNLTFLGPEDNDVAANEGFDKKRPLFAKSSVKLNREIAKLLKWDAGAIDTREKKLINLALKVFAV